ncbi:MAG: DNA translocase FtsK [Pseudomonadota bacterium]
MAKTAPLKTDDSAIPAALSRFVRNRVSELSGAGLMALTGAIAVALATWNVRDPSLSFAIDRVPQNALGYPGAVIADILMQGAGLAVVAVLAPMIVWSLRLMAHGGVQKILRRIVMWTLGTAFAAGSVSALPIPAAWALETGLGGAIGDIALIPLVAPLKLILGGTVAHAVAAPLYAFLGVACILSACNFRQGELTAVGRLFGEAGVEVISAVAGFVTHHVMHIAGRLQKRKEARKTRVVRAEAAEADPDVDLPSFLKRGRRMVNDLVNDEEDLAAPGMDLEAAPERGEPVLDMPVLQRRTANPGEPADDVMDDGPSRVTPAAKPPRQGTRVKKEAQPSLFRADGNFELPPLSLLSEAPKQNQNPELTEEALEQNARMLEGVLEDFGVRGEIINVRPGPVVTLYELEPAPGIKSSRVIGLADDIARSMSAISARVAVVPGRNAIGIELPNTKRETVFFRELLASQTYERSKHNLCLALGKNIGGEPIFADLARMPHLLIAGTTGSGKSVGINTMILSLLYKLPPDKCKLIMIDPKMLELSIYEGIPHLLSPVVTDPKKAVVALKWAVREMEERYRNMSKMGVRNIDGFNERIAQAQKKGEVLTRTVQTGYDPETGEPIYEQEEMDLQFMPYIVVIIDEMADLMMVAGKDIEGAVQRLAQMARAAGIHVIMATQRPSVDVITGTIKANFPTRISFQVTSKIDSRTILGEMGAEQLLGQGDMLYMAGGGRISRLHGAFVKDDEVEDIVRHLKAQGAPEYVQAVTEETDDMDGGGMPGMEMESTGDDLYDRAVAVVIQDGKASTSYVQRRLQIGYNRAATLIEKMEQEGVISPANHAGKREILVGGADETLPPLD